MTAQRLLNLISLSILLASFSVGGLTSAEAQGQIETLDPGPMPALLAPKPAPTDWRRDMPAAEIQAQIASLSRKSAPSATDQLRLIKLRSLLRPMLPPPLADQALRQAYAARVAIARALRRGARKQRGSGFTIQSLAAPPPQKEFLQVKATPVYFRKITLQKGHEYVIETRHLSAGSDTVLYVAREGQQLAYNDDRSESDRSSLVHFTPDRTGEYTLIVRAYDDSSAGSCDLYIDGQAGEQGIQFAGSVVRWSWKPGDEFQTAHLPSTYARPVDTVLFAFDGMKLVGWNDDGGIAGCSLLKLSSASTSSAAHVLAASYSQDPADADWVMLYRNALSGPDSDGDGLADSLEQSLGTDPNSIDTDGDGLRDDWEVFGVHTPDGDEDLPSDAGIGINSEKGSDPHGR